MFFNVSTINPSAALALMAAAGAAIPDPNGVGGYWPGSVVIWGPAGQGKTALVRERLRRLYGGAGALALAIARRTGLPPRQVAEELFLPGGIHPTPEDLGAAREIPGGPAELPSLRRMARIVLRAFLAGEEAWLEEAAPCQGLRRLVGMIAVLPTVEVADFLGVLRVNEEGRTEWARPAFLPAEGQGLMVLDDPFLGRPEIARAANNLLQFAALAGVEVDAPDLDPQYHLPPFWQVVITSNRPEDVPGRALWVPDPPIRNRALQLLMGPEEEGEGLPLFESDSERERIRVWAARMAAEHLRHGRRAGWPPAILAYLARWPEMAAVPPAVGGVERAAFATWRSWEIAGWMLRALREEAGRLETPEASDRAEALGRAALEATIGREAAADFWAVLGRALDFRIPDVEDILRDPESAPIPIWEEGKEAGWVSAMWLAVETAAAAGFRRHGEGRPALEACRYLLRVAEAMEGALRAGLAAPMDALAGAMGELLRLPGQAKQLAGTGILGRFARFPGLRAVLFPDLRGDRHGEYGE